MLPLMQERPFRSHPRVGIQVTRAFSDTSRQHLPFPWSAVPLGSMAANKSACQKGLGSFIFALLYSASLRSKKAPITPMGNHIWEVR